ncbi:hypothetical protein ACFL9S_18215 [Erwinia sp. AnSW2-5]|uniref:hypothetical protein n=1 Tax=Erwinia sp. AnSW2-5 TaxID=3367692 RepID=UPI00385BB615
MQYEHFIFFTKEGMVIPQSLNEDDVGKIICSVLFQGFNISPLHIMAVDNRSALDKFEKIMESAIGKNITEVTVC